MKLYSEQCSEQHSPINENSFKIPSTSQQIKFKKWESCASF